MNDERDEILIATTFNWLLFLEDLKPLYTADIDSEHDPTDPKCRCTMCQLTPQEIDEIASVVNDFFECEKAKCSVCGDQDGSFAIFLCGRCNLPKSAIVCDECKPECDGDLFCEECQR